MPNTCTADDNRRTNTIRQLNDAFRATFQGGRVLITRGVADRPDLDDILEQVRTFDRFTARDDPHCEHDFGAIKIAGGSVFWKLDYYDVDLQCGSPDPADPAVTTRVLTIMLAEEY